MFDSSLTDTDRMTDAVVTDDKCKHLFSVLLKDWREGCDGYMSKRIKVQGTLSSQSRMS